MLLSVKFKKEGHKKFYKNSLIVIEKKKNIKSVMREKIGNYACYKESLVVYISVVKLHFWKNSGVVLSKKVQSVLKNVE